MFGLIRIHLDWIFGLDESVPGLILIHSDWKFTSDSFRFMWIKVSDWIGLSGINLQAFFNKRDSKRFSDWFGLIRIDFYTDIGMIRNSSDWLGLNSYPKLSPGFGISFVEKRWKINPSQSYSIRDFYPNESERIRNQFSIRMNQNQSGSIRRNRNRPICPYFNEGNNG